MKLWKKIKNMNYQRAYDFLLSLGNYPRREYMNDPRHCSLYLKRLLFFLRLLDNPERKIKHFIHVTGTSGKGSLTAMLHSILQASGKKTGSSYSPHPSQITERWRIGGRNMGKDKFIQLIESIKPKLDTYIRRSPYGMLSFFELCEAIGLLWFAQNKVDWVVLEAACGGRYDSSNILPKKDVAVITNIGLDHLGIIGNNKKEIAHEKAGIITKDCAAFTAEKESGIKMIIQKQADKQDVKLHTIDTGAYRPVKHDWQGIKFRYKDRYFTLPVIGRHQAHNAMLAIDIARFLGIRYSNINKGLNSISLPIRMEVARRDPFIILDSAHNEDKIKSTVQTLLEINKEKKPLHLLIGFSEDKNLKNILTQLVRLRPQTIACTRNTINPLRKVADPVKTARKLKKMLPKTKIEVFFAPDSAFDYLRRQAEREDIILCTGSVFLSGELRGYLGKN